MGGGGGWANPLQTLSQGLVLTLRFTFGPELDNRLYKATLKELYLYGYIELDGLTIDNTMCS